LKSFLSQCLQCEAFLKIFLSPLGLDFEKSWSVRKLFRFYWLVSKDNQLSWMRSGDQLCSPGVFCLLIYRIFVLFRDKLMQLLPIYAKSRGRKKIVYLTLSYNGGWRFLFLHWNEGSPNSVFRRRFKHQHFTEANQFY
jgi:hypothetical protein